MISNGIKYEENDLWWLQTRMWLTSLRYHPVVSLFALMVVLTPVIAFVVVTVMSIIHGIVSEKLIRNLLDLPFISQATLNKFVNSETYTILFHVLKYTFNAILYLLITGIICLGGVILSMIIYKFFEDSAVEVHLDGRDLQFVLKKAKPHQVQMIKDIEARVNIFKRKTIFDLCLGELFFNEEFMKEFTNVIKPPEPEKVKQLTKKELELKELKGKTLDELIIMKEQDDLTAITAKKLKKKPIQIL